MVWIHGGGFSAGTGGDQFYGPQYLLDRDVILVSVQYRLGPFGFLNLGMDGVAAGNQGMWDQREALRWVRENVDPFNGDPDKVTLFGESAGGMSVSAHLLANEDKNGALFRAAIPQSGTLHSAFLNLDRKEPMSHYHNIYIGKMGCGGASDKKKCLRELSIGDIMAHSSMFDDCNLLVGDTMNFPTPWKPSDDSKFSSDPFFPDDPHKLMARGIFSSRPKGQVKIMTGYTKHEGLITIGSLLQSQTKLDMLE